MFWARLLTRPWTRKVKVRFYSTTGGEEEISTDLLIVGAGPAGLAAAIRAKQLDPNLQVTVIEKAAELGGHTLSGICFEPRALDELLPEWREDASFPLRTEAERDSFYLLTGRESSWRVPILPAALHNRGNRLGSLSEMVRWLGEQATSLGVDIFAGFGAAQLLLNPDHSVAGIVTNELGRGKDGRERPGYTPGMALRAKLTLLAEGAHGSLSKQAIARFSLRRGVQTYGIGLKEVWQVSPDRHEPGLVMHTVGWPLDSQTYGGSFLYHYYQGAEEQPLVSLGLVIGLDYRNPYLNPYREFQRLKLHPLIKETLKGGRCLSYGARALNEGGYQSIPRLDFPGGALIGCAAGFLNVPKIKGTHTAMKSGMLGAEEAVAVLQGRVADLSGLNGRIVEESWIGPELWAVRNVRPAFHHQGLWAGLAYAGLDQLVLRGRAPWTLPHGPPDHACLEPAALHQPIEYPKPDGQLTFELLESVSRTGTGHEEDQPSHLQLKDPSVQVRVNLPEYAGPEQRFCPAGVYEYVEDERGKPRFQINASNCIHCKTCDIKDPSQNINWQVPEGGGGPKYSNT